MQVHFHFEWLQSSSMLPYLSARDCSCFTRSRQTSNGQKPSDASRFPITQDSVNECRVAVFLSTPHYLLPREHRWKSSRSPPPLGKTQRLFISEVCGVASLDWSRGGHSPYHHQGWHSLRELIYEEWFYVWVKVWFWFCKVLVRVVELEYWVYAIIMLN